MHIKTNPSNFWSINNGGDYWCIRLRESAAQRSGSLFSHRESYLHVWQWDGDGRPAFLNQHVDVYKNMRWTNVSSVVAAPSITMGAEGENAITFGGLLLVKCSCSCPVPLKRVVAFQIRGI